MLEKLSGRRAWNGWRKFKMKKGQAEIIAIMIGLMVLGAVVVVGYEGVTGIKLAAIMAGDVAQDSVTRINSVMMAPYSARAVVECPSGYEFDINNGRFSVRLKRFLEDETVDSYYLVRSGSELPTDMHVMCNFNFFCICR